MLHHTEGQIQRACLEYAEACQRAGYKIMFARTNAGKIKKGNYYIHLLPEGWGDITGHVNGIFVMCELKKKTGEQRDTQIKMQKKCIESGGLYWICYTIKAFKAKLKEHDIVLKRK